MYVFLYDAVTYSANVNTHVSAREMSHSSSNCHTPTRVPREGSSSWQHLVRQGRAAQAVSFMQLTKLSGFAGMPSPE